MFYRLRDHTGGWIAFARPVSSPDKGQTKVQIYLYIRMCFSFALYVSLNEADHLEIAVSLPLLAPETVCSDVGFLFLIPAANNRKLRRSPGAINAILST